MRCPYCGVAARAAYVEETASEARTRWICGNRRCSAYKQAVGETVQRVREANEAKTSEGQEGEA